MEKISHCISAVRKKDTFFPKNENHFSLVRSGGKVIESE
jgi:hypothetical protein